MRSFSDLLDQLRGVSPEIELHVKMEAFVFASDWYSTLIWSQLNPTEVVVFLQLLAIYKITGSFLSDRLLGLLEKVQPTERVVALVKILGLTDEIPCMFPFSFYCLFHFEMCPCTHKITSQYEYAGSKISALHISDYEILVPIAFLIG